MNMSCFDNLGLCHNDEGIAPKFAAMARERRRMGDGDIKNAPDLSAFEMLVIAVIAKQLYDA